MIKYQKIGNRSFHVIKTCDECGKEVFNGTKKTVSIFWKNKFICDECKEAAFEKEKQDNFKVASLHATISGYPQLKGSYKQIRWAEVIRHVLAKRNLVCSEFLFKTEEASAFIDFYKENYKKIGSI